MTREQKSKAAKWNHAKRMYQSRFVITFNRKGSYNRTTGRYTKYSWPILFPTEEAAWRAIHCLPVFANRDPIPGRGKIINCCVERLILKHKGEKQCR